MKKLNPMGIGPKMAVVLLPWLAITIILSITKETAFKYSSTNTRLLLIPGIILMLAGLMFYFSTVRILLKGLKETRLMTTGPYSMCQHPLYASLMLGIIPALSLMLNSWLVLTTSIVGYFLLKRFIKIEEAELKNIFGEEYLKYKKATPVFFPGKGKIINI